MVNRTTASILCLAILLVGNLRLHAAPPVQENPGAPQQQTPTSASSGQTSPPAILPEGLTAPSNSLLDQNLLTGDWGGFRNTLGDEGIKFSPTLTAEVFGNPSGACAEASSRMAW